MKIIQFSFNKIPFIKITNVKMVHVSIFQTWNNLHLCLFLPGEKLDQVETAAVIGTMKPIGET